MMSKLPYRGVEFVTTGGGSVALASPVAIGNRPEVGETSHLDIVTYRGDGVAPAAGGAGGTAELGGGVAHSLRDHLAEVGVAGNARSRDDPDAGEGSVWSGGRERGA